MLTAQQIKDRVAEEKDPLQYIDGEVAWCANQMGALCANIQDTISAYNRRVNADDQIDIQKIKEDLMKTGEIYWEMNLFLKTRKEQVKRQNRAEQLNKALVKRGKSSQSSKDK